MFGGRRGRQGRNNENSPNSRRAAGTLGHFPPPSHLSPRRAPALHR